jgi:hypothetical protein
MDNVYERSEDLHVRGTYVYVKAGDVYAYADSATTVKIDAVALKNLFLKGAIVNAAGVLFKPTGLKVTAGVAALSYVTADDDPVTTAVMALLYSSEHVAG